MGHSISSRHQYLEDGPFSGLEPPTRKRTHSSAYPARLYDVFINHRGPDVKETVALQLYKSLRNMGFQVFLDSQEIPLGDYFPSTLQNAIRSASVHIAIFSKGYAMSAWCLAELVFMLETDTKIIPVFYDVEPSDLRYIEKGVYADAFIGYKQKGRYIDKLDKWKEALNSVSFINGYEFGKNNQDPHDMCKKVLSAVLKNLENTKSSDVAKHSVGLDKLVEELERVCLQRREDENIVGIFGSTGKTTLAEDFFSRKRSNYDGSSFLYDVREASARSELCSMQSKLLNDLFHQNHPKFQTTEQGIVYLRNCMKRGSSLRFLIVLNDIDRLDQLDALLDRDALNSDSLVIVTTRDERLLKSAGITCRYKIEPMDEESSTFLFCWHAFRQPYPAPGYEDLVRRVVRVSKGSVLCLEVLGRHLFGHTDKLYWQLELDKVCEGLPRDIKQKLKICFESLDGEQKHIFMDITCFFIGRPKDMAIRIWKGSGWKAEHALRVLQDRRFVMEFDVSKPTFRVRGLLLDFGREMANESRHPLRLWHPSHLKSLESKGFRHFLSQTSGLNVRCFSSMFDPSLCSQITFFLGKSHDCDNTSTTLLWLDIYNYGRKLISIPSWIPLQNLEHFKIENAM